MADFDVIYEMEEDSGSIPPDRQPDETSLKSIASVCIAVTVPDPVVIRGAGNFTL